MTKKPIYESHKIFKGRQGFSRNTRPYHLYVLRPKGLDSLQLNGYEFVKFDKRFLDARERLWISCEDEWFSSELIFPKEKISKW
jgi:hypothetical protein